MYLLCFGYQSIDLAQRSPALLSLPCRAGALVVLLGPKAVSLVHLAIEALYTGIQLRQVGMWDILVTWNGAGWQPTILQARHACSLYANMGY